VITKRNLSVLLAATASICALAVAGNHIGSLKVVESAHILAGAASSLPSTPAMPQADAARLARQATFGPTVEAVTYISTIGAEKWISEQFNKSGSSYLDFANPLPLDYCKDYNCYRARRTREQLAMRFYRNAVSSPDQLRQRVALALSELMVTSMQKVDDAAGMAAYQQIFLDNAFGNYRTILATVTQNGYMGEYLDMANSNKSMPSENYAREMLQLFSMGPFKLNTDGTLQRDASGAAVENYSPQDVKGVARALTGWTYAHINNGSVVDYYSRDYTKPMNPLAWFYDSSSKSFIGSLVPAGATQLASLNAAVDSAFNHPSTPPHLAKYLIQQLVTSNPSPAYVSRVSSAFVNNGENVRGDMKAMIRAILLDPEARGSYASAASSGKVKEPILFLTSMARALSMSTDGLVFEDWDDPLGQPVFLSPSVFNFYPPDYPLRGQQGLLSPASKLMTTGQIALRSKLAFAWTIGATAPRSEFSVRSWIASATGTLIDWTSWESIGSDFDVLADRVSLLFMDDTMTSTQRAALRANWDAVVDADPRLQARKRAAALLYIVFSSPQFQVDR
jgi:uncharacterized protein (DUF1800 family)